MIMIKDLMKATTLGEKFTYSWTKLLQADDDG